MAFLNWQDSFSVGIGSIDNQHKKLCDLVNQLHEAMGSGKGNEAAGKIILETVKYAQQHFTFEESYMKSINYPLFNDHKKLHENLTRQAAELKKKVENNERLNVIQISQFLKDWLRNHILKEDIKYAQHRQTASV